MLADALLLCDAHFVTSHKRGDEVPASLHDKREGLSSPTRPWRVTGTPGSESRKEKNHDV